jgi:hypothetical protein
LPDFNHLKHINNKNDEGSPVTNPARESYNQDELINYGITPVINPLKGMNDQNTLKND